MKKIYYGLLVGLVVLGCVTVLSCGKDETGNTECDILSAWVEGEEYEQYFYQKSDMRKDNISSTETEIVFYVKSLADLPSLPVHFSLTEGATINPSNGSVHSFNEGPVVYMVTSEDGANQRQYRVVFEEHVDSVVDFGAVYHVFYEINDNGDSNYLWASGNKALTLVHSDWNPMDFPTHSIADGYHGKGVCLTTVDAGQLGRSMHKPIAAGNLFIGQFDINYVLSNPLKCCVFGTPVNREPLKVTGYYKYQPGAEFTDANMNIDPDRTDVPNIYAVLFRNQNEDGESISLSGEDVFTSPYVVSIARVASLPATNQWQRFEMYFTGSQVNAEVLAAFGYSMTIVFSSSRDGDTFEGAIGSSLYVDEVEVEYKNQ